MYERVRISNWIRFKRSNEISRTILAVKIRRHKSINRTIFFLFTSGEIHNIFLDDNEVFLISHFYERVPKICFHSFDLKNTLHHLLF